MHYFEEQVKSEWKGRSLSKFLNLLTENFENLVWTAKNKLENVFDAKRLKNNKIGRGRDKITVALSTSEWAPGMSAGKEGGQGWGTSAKSPKKGNISNELGYLRRIYE